MESLGGVTLEQSWLAMDLMERSRYHTVMYLHVDLT